MCIYQDLMFILSTTGSGVRNRRQKPWVGSSTRSLRKTQARSLLMWDIRTKSEFEYKYHFVTIHCLHPGWRRCYLKEDLLQGDGQGHLLQRRRNGQGGFFFGVLLYWNKSPHFSCKVLPGQGKLVNISLFAWLQCLGLGTPGCKRC